MTDAVRLPAIRGNPNALTPHYTRFRVHDRLLLTGHSHQAWPDCGFQAQQDAWTDAASLVDDKWDRAFDKAEAVRQGYRRLLDDPTADIALGTNTHELGVRFLSALPLDRRPRLVTTDGEFHSLRRQLDRLAEVGITITRVAGTPVDTLAERLGDHVDDKTAAVFVSAVFFKNARIVPHLSAVQHACIRMGAEMFVDAYHALNVTRFSVRDEALDRAFVTGGGYKYCQLGEGNCFLRVPTGSTMRPVVTGWYAEFEDLSHDTERRGVRYGNGAAAFAGATYDPTSHYRAARVFAFFEELELTPTFLREISQHQIGLLMDAFDQLDVDPAIVTRDRSCKLGDIGGFLSLETPHAELLHAELAERGVRTDWRDTVLRFGPAPYHCDDQLAEAMALLGDAVTALS